MGGLIKLRALRFLVSRELSREESEEGREVLSDLEEVISVLEDDGVGSAEPFVRPEQEKPVHEGVPKDNHTFACAKCGGPVVMAVDPGTVPFPVCASCRNEQERE